VTTDLQHARADLRAFSTLIGHELAPWQAESLRLERRTTVVVAPRQSGKSRSLSVLALWWAYRRPDQRVLIVSAGEDAARRLLASASSVAVRSPLLATSVVDENAGLLVLSNGSEVRSVPASERQVRGWTVDLLLVDEAALVDDDLLLGAAVPTTAARPEARIVLAGSPAAAEGAFFNYAQAGLQGSEHVGTYRWSLADAGWIALDVVAGAREQLAPAAFAREFEGEFADVEGDERVVQRDWIAGAQERSLDVDGEPLFGLDVARRGGDESVLVSVRGGRVRVEWASRGLDLMALSSRVVLSVGSAPVWVDAIGLGAGVLDRLSELGGHAVPFIASARASNPQRYLNLRAETWWHARECFRLGVVDLDPLDRVMAEQLGAVAYKLAPSGSLQIQSKDEMRTSPDRADSLVIALWAARQSAGLGMLRQIALQVASAPAHPLLVGMDSEQSRPSGLWRGSDSGLTLFGGGPVSGRTVAEEVEAMAQQQAEVSEWMRRLW